MRYRNVQVGYVIVITLGVAIAIAIGYLINVDYSTSLAIVTAVLVAIAILFMTLTVEVNGEKVRLYFGVGLIKRSFALEQIRSVHEVRNHWIYGWGIRYTPHGPLYNVSGLKAVEIELSNGRKYRIGTNEPDKLRSVISEAIDPGGGDQSSTESL